MNKKRLAKNIALMFVPYVVVRSLGIAASATGYQLWWLYLDVPMIVVFGFCVYIKTWAEQKHQERIDELVDEIKRRQLSLTKR